MQRLDTWDYDEPWRRAAIMLKEIKASLRKADELQKIVAQLKNNLEASAGQNHSQDSRHLYEKHYLVARLQASVERLLSETVELENLEKSLQTMIQKADMDEKIRQQIREQLRKKLEIIFKEK